jgi:hypothetical protein
MYVRKSLISQGVFLVAGRFPPELLWRTVTAPSVRFEVRDLNLD